MFPSWFMVFKLSEKEHFLQFCADISSKSKSVKAIYIYTFYIYTYIPYYALSENGIIYYAMTYCFGDSGVWNRRILLNFCWVSMFLMFWSPISHKR